MTHLVDKVVVVSGIGPGLGRAIALGCGEAGAHVVVAARTASRVDALARTLHERGTRALGIVADIADAGARDTLVARTIEVFGRVDALVNNAFVMGPMERADALTPEDWRAVFEVNVIGTMALSTAFAIHMRTAGEGSIVMINSQSARRGAARRGPYAASKAALLVAAQVLAAELGPSGVRVNSVVPGQIWGASLEEHYAAVAARRGVPIAEVVAQVTRDIPLGRITTAEEITDAVVFLLSDRSAAITGQSLDVNGGSWFQ